MKPAFEEHKVDESLSKIKDVIHRPSGGPGAPSWAEADSAAVVRALEELEERMRSQNMDLQHGGLPIAIYAARQLDKYVSGMHCDIANNDGAQVFCRCLAGLIQELRPLDEQLAKQRAA